MNHLSPVRNASFTVPQPEGDELQLFNRRDYMYSPRFPRPRKPVTRAGERTAGASASAVFRWSAKFDATNPSFTFTPPRRAALKTS
jgi:hypothetical protein